MNKRSTTLATILIIITLQGCGSDSQEAPAIPTDTSHTNTPTNRVAIPLAVRANLGITFARLNQYDNAVKHYRAYLKLTPNAPDAEAVQRILSDYDKAQSNR